MPSTPHKKTLKTFFKVALLTFFLSSFYCLFLGCQAQLFYVWQRHPQRLQFRDGQILAGRLKKLLDAK
jgi:hypothetical protein